jgi:tRNA A37 threonylcarbamoyladenosine biosynthesis protein TsaE
LDCERKHARVSKSDKEISARENPTAYKPVLILLAGTAGAGKTTFYESQLRTVFLLF